MNVHSGKYSARYMKRALPCVFVDAKLIKTNTINELKIPCMKNKSHSI